MKPHLAFKGGKWCCYETGDKLPISFGSSVRVALAAYLNFIHYRDLLIPPQIKRGAF